MSESKQVPWVQIGIEGVAIVLSILLAFGIDAWYDRVSQQDRSEDYERRIAVELTDPRNSMLYLKWVVVRAEAAAESVAPFFEGDQRSFDMVNAVQRARDPSRAEYLIGVRG